MHDDGAMTAAPSLTDNSPLIAVLVIGLGLAFLFGTIANRLKFSPIVGYLLAGVAVGPFTPGFVANHSLTLQLAEIGVILLMFGVGLHFSPGDLISVRRIAIPGALLQVAIATMLGEALAWLIGWNFGTGIVFGLALAIASTVVMTRTLQDRHLMDSGRGRIAVGWLVMQDFITVLALVLLPPIALALKGGHVDPAGLAKALGYTVLKLGGFVAFMLIVGRRVIPWVLHYTAHTGSRELFRLAVLSVALGVAFGAAELFGVSIALGAFFAGMIMSGSPLSQRATEETLPLRDAFAVLFFVSVGMLFDPLVVVHEPGLLAMALLVVVIGIGGVAFLIARAFGYPLATALFIGAGLAQIGEFSFILADLGISQGLLPDRARDLILGTSILSIIVNPFLVAAAERFRKPEAVMPEAVREKPAELQPTQLAGHAIVVGYGRVGSLVAEGMKSDGTALLVIEEAQDRIEKLAAANIEAIEGNAATERVLKAANIAGARLLFVAIPEAFEAGQIVQQARKVNPGLEIVARAHFDAEVDHLLKLGASQVVMGEREIARAMLDHARGVA
ncbi:MAG TPA: YbaL family putative K(+) efflux transporter [Rhizomicrobium sp.]|nr:YbaL family putative K(+) efflux transporter [Rhizomicrobium sp.]